MTKVRGSRSASLTLQIYYASRTHSQLSQFIGEIRKTPFADTRAIALGSRANLCINDDVKRAAKGTEDLNERCLDLQKKGTPGDLSVADTLRQGALPVSAAARRAGQARDVSRSCALAAERDRRPRRPRSPFAHVYVHVFERA